MTDFFANRGPVFAAIDATGSASPSIGITASSGGSAGGTAGQFQSAMSSQASDYTQAQGLEEQSHKMQMMGDAALKALKAVQIS